QATRACQSCSWLRSLQAFGGRNANKVEAVANHLTCSIVQPESRAVQISGRFVALRNHSTVVVPTVVVGSKLLEIARDAMRFAQFSRTRDDARILLQLSEQFSLGFVC